ncbi:MAG TPA: phosphate-starvation-inducible PsiE family protein [Syntrophales bacterium]|nr:phosphate-starvation-inducible PsiE family protein [Syntrophales bacterium]HOX95029.1 phosphate-starvation-inducible PsiE family protein [Syntrophales bacterium]HPI57288.1 phosphate-starvation-inducible PsiE family protein [Syntrophales bacterium]HPN25168.1 phosphate-starvation-inducible PsiE family protein [Syntrophales bacterium]HQM29412.1 phosphate-starvation-inducible PsiE family protein [Syntrophales bacterium]
MTKFLQTFEKVIIVSLMAMMAFVVLISTVELGVLIIRDVISPPVIFLELDELLGIFGFFLLILIGIELLETIKIYVKDHLIRVEVVLLVALIAVARKVIILDIKDITDFKLVGIAALIVALTAGLFFLKRCDACMISSRKKEGEDA